MPRLPQTLVPESEGFRGGPFFGDCCLSAVPCLISCWNETKDHSESFFLGCLARVVYSDRSEKKSFLAGFVVDFTVIDTYFGISLILP